MTTDPDQDRPDDLDSHLDRLMETAVQALAAGPDERGRSERAQATETPILPRLAVPPTSLKLRCVSRSK